MLTSSSPLGNFANDPVAGALRTMRAQRDLPTDTITKTLRRAFKARPLTRAGGDNDASRRLKSEHDKLACEYATLRECHAPLCAAHNTLKASYETLQDRFDSLAAASTTFVSGTEALQAERAALMGQSDALNYEPATLLDGLHPLMSAAEEIIHDREDHAVLQSQFEILKHKHRALKGRVDLLNRQRAESGSRCNRLNRENRDWRINEPHLLLSSGDGRSGCTGSRVSSEDCGVDSGD
jgi:FtsZ-binding cell division protein ZapB